MLALVLSLALGPVHAADVEADEADEFAWDSFVASDDDEEPDDEPEPDEEIDVPTTVVRTTTTTGTKSTPNPGEDEFAFEEPPEPKVVAAAMPGPVSLEVAGKEPLADNYAASLVAVDRDAVVIELPVLVAKSRTGAEPFVLIASVYAGAVKVGEVRQSFSASSLAEFGPTFAFLKVAAPVVEPKGEVKITVAKAKADGTGAVDLFSRSVAYALK